MEIIKRGRALEAMKIILTLIGDFEKERRKGT
jgi:hypothetical protein